MMKSSKQTPGRSGYTYTGIVLLIAALAATLFVAWTLLRPKTAVNDEQTSSSTAPLTGTYNPREPLDTSGLYTVMDFVGQLPPNATLSEISSAWKDAGFRAVERLETNAAQQPFRSPSEVFSMMYTKSILLNFEGRPQNAYETLRQMRMLLDREPELAKVALFSVIYMQGITALRRGENENCILCRGESSCILPIVASARHTAPEGSRQAIGHFTEYLAEFPDDLEIRWLLNLAHMTLGEYPDKVDPRFLITLDHFDKPEFDIGRFRDIGHLVGVNQLTEAGGAIMDDFDNDGLLDIVVTSFDPSEQMILLLNTGQGTFEDRTSVAGLTGQLGGANCVQTDYNNDGFLDIYVMRGGWVPYPIRQTLLRNNCNGTFTDVTKEAGLLVPVNSMASSWADYDNDGWLDLFVCCERQANRLYHNLRNGKFEEVAARAGLTHPKDFNCKGAAWIDYDNDGFPDLFQDYLSESENTRLFHNNRDGTFGDVTRAQGIHGPAIGFSCWAWDYDNDGWQDLFATSYDRSVKDVVRGLMGQPHKLNSNRLYHNCGGTGFDDVTKEAGLDLVFATMGSNFGDFDNDGFLDVYLGTGDPNLSMLVPNRMFKNVGGKRFAEISASSGTGHLQKGHSVACGDWDRNGNNDIFIEMGGAVPGDKYHNILFQNPGNKNHWLTVKLTGEKSNRAAIGARVKIVTTGSQPQTFYRHVSSGSSFGANSLQQTIGLADAERISTLEVFWPASNTTQVFSDLAVDQAIAITEFASDFQKLDWTPIAIPVENTENRMLKGQGKAIELPVRRGD